MKKLLALALAAVMVLGLSSVAFAATDIVAGVELDAKNDPQWHALTTDPSDEIDPKTGGKKGNQTPNSVNATAKTSFAYGNTIYSVLLDDAGGFITKSDSVKSVSIKQKWDMGKEWVESISIVKKKHEDKSYRYFLCLKLKAAPTATAINDVIGKITLKKTSGAYAFAGDIEIPINLTLQHTDLSSNTLDTETRRIVKDGKGVQGEDSITFENLGYFESDFTGQGKVAVYYDNKFNAAVAAKFPAANLDFFNGNYAAFNKIGDFTLYADPGSYLYYIAEDGTISAMDAEYDDYEEAFKFRTRTLGKYIISDMELGLAAVTPVTAVVGAPAAAVTAAPTEIKTVPVTGV